MSSCQYRQGACILATRHGSHMLQGRRGPRGGDSFQPASSSHAHNRSLLHRSTHVCIRTDANCMSALLVHAKRTCECTCRCAHMCKIIHRSASEQHQRRCNSTCNLSDVKVGLHSGLDGWSFSCFVFECNTQGVDYFIGFGKKRIFNI